METVHSDTYPFSVITESIAISDDQRVRFELLWKAAKEAEKLINYG